MGVRVIRIFDRRRVVINIGSDDAVETGTRFDIYSRGTSIRDPETDEVLGEYRLHKATVFASEVYPRFTVAMPPTRRERIPDPNAPVNAFQSMLRPPTRVRTVPGELEVQREEIIPLEGGSSVAVGDIVEVTLPARDEVEEDQSASNTSSDE